MRRKFILSLAVILLISLTATNITFAIGHYQQLKAFFKNIQIYRNGEQVNLNLPEGSFEPFIVNGRTYVPVRAISELFDKEVLWDGVNYRIDINDKPGQGSNESIDYLIGQLQEKDKIIDELKDKIEELEKQLEDLEPSLSQVEKELNKEFGEYKDIEFDIELSGDEDDIEVEIYVDLDEYWDEWKDLSTSKIEDYIEDIVDYILDEFEDADVYGFIEDEPLKDILVEFRLNSKDKLEIDFDDDDDLVDLQIYLNEEYDEVDGKKVYIDLDWDKDDIEVTLWIDYYDFKKLDLDEVEDYLYDLYDEIEYDYDNVEVYGYFVSDDKYEEELLYFEFDSKGKLVEFDKK